MAFRFFMAVAITDDPIPRIIAQTVPMLWAEQASNAARQYARKHPGVSVIVLEPSNSSFRGEIDVRNEYLDWPEKSAGEPFPHEPPAGAWNVSVHASRPSAPVPTRYPVFAPELQPRPVGAVAGEVPEPRRQSGRWPSPNPIDREPREPRIVPADPDPLGVEHELDDRAADIAPQIDVRHDSFDPQF
jgi:hypothetical protein